MHAFLLLAAAAAAPGANLKTFHYPNHQTAGDAPLWARVNWGSVLTDVSDVVSAGRTWGRNFDMRSTMAHETCHSIVADLEHADCKGSKGFYLVDNTAACVPYFTKFTKDDVCEFIPTGMRWHRYQMYLEEINVGGDALIVLEEWACYTIEAMTALELYDDELLVVQGKIDESTLKNGYGKETATYDTGLGAVEFMGYSFAVGMAMEKHEPEYLDTEMGKNFREFIGFNTERTLTTFCRLLQLYPDVFSSWTLEENWAKLTTGEDGKSFREFAARWFGEEWWNNLLTCKAVAPKLASNGPVPSVDTLRGRY
eukprot:TRINITY_DN3899_c0_g2_i2.p1 TRINITY_DN3899_c0_g2~~TRINITY_DN3899_c0_g2_i2.p1  ORF type:complete len:311 (+),score=154.14 TRINITY_DN3899_c0_g2_i2:46-978(+)